MMVIKVLKKIKQGNKIYHENEIYSVNDKFGKCFCSLKMAEKIEKNNVEVHVNELKQIVNNKEMKLTNKKTK
jgi:hypothetical protein